jgi:hypothetical protein
MELIADSTASDAGGRAVAESLDIFSLADPNPGMLAA